MGMFVAAVRPARSASRRLALLEPALQAAAQQASELGLGAGQALQLFERCLARAGLPGGPVEEEP
jgi:GntR family transcriptional regulator